MDKNYSEINFIVANVVGDGRRWLTCSINGKCNRRRIFAATQKAQLRANFLLQIYREDRGREKERERERVGIKT